MGNMKSQKGITLEDETPRLEGVQYATGEEQRATTNSSRRNGVIGPKQKQRSVAECLVVKVKSDAVKKNVA